MRGVFLAAGGGPGDVQFEVVSHGKRTATAETDSGGAHVMNRAGNPTGCRSFAGQTKTNRQREFKSPPCALFCMCLCLHIRSPHPSTAGRRGEQVEIARSEEHTSELQSPCN